MVVGAMRLQQTSDDESQLQQEPILGQQQRTSLPRMGVALAVMAAVGLLGVLAWTGSSKTILPGRFETVISRVEEETTAAPEETTAASDEETTAPEGDDDDDDDDEDGEEEEEDVNYLSEECKAKFTTVFDELTEAYNAFLSKCEGVDTSGNPEDLPDACKHAIDTYWSTHDKMPDFKGGKCIHDDFMECQVEQVINGTDYSHKACMPKVCKPLNMVMNGIQKEKETGLCEAEGADCSVSIACAGHEKVTKAMAMLTGKSGALAKSAGLAVVALATTFSF